MEKPSKIERQSFIFFGGLLWIILMILVDLFYIELEGLNIGIIIMSTACTFFILILEIKNRISLPR